MTQDGYIEVILEKDEEVLLSCACRTEVSNKEVVGNFIMGMLSNGFAGRGIHDYIITLTNKRLHIQGLRYDLTSSIPDVQDILKHEFKDIETFSYKTINDKIYITLAINDKKKTHYNFILKDKDHLGVIKSMKEYIEEGLK